MATRRPRRLTLIIGTALAISVPAVAETGPGPAANADAPTPERRRDECIDAHRKSQELRQQDKFIEAREQVLICSSSDCPGVLIADCAKWFDELNQATPSMVFEFSRDGRDAPETRLFVDGTRVTEWSHAYRTNPGRHTVRVELPPFPVHEEELMLSEGQRLRVVAVQFKSASTPVAAPRATGKLAQARVVRRTPTLVYPLVGLGVAGLASFGAFAYLGQTKQNGLERSCEPSCTDEQVRPMKQRYLAADISLGVGGAALVSALVMYLTRPQTDERPTALHVRILAPTLADGGAGGWGLSATGKW